MPRKMVWCCPFFNHVKKQNVGWGDTKMPLSYTYYVFLELNPIVRTLTSFAPIAKVDWQLYCNIFRLHILLIFGRVMVNGILWSCLSITNHNVTGKMDIPFKKHHTQGLFLSLIALYCFLLFAGIVFIVRVSVFFPWCFVCSWAAIWGEPLQGESQGFVLAWFTCMLDSRAED